MLLSVCERAGINSSGLGIFESLCNSELERPVHSEELVLDVVLQWTEWPTSHSTDSKLIIKRNHIYAAVKPHVNIVTVRL